MTGHVRNLEKTLGQPLFLRTPQRVVPTDAAHDLVQQTSRPLDDLKSVIDRSLQPEGISDRPLHLAGPPGIMLARVLPALADLMCGGLRLRVGLGLAEDLLRGLEAGEHDLVISTLRPLAILRLYWTSVFHQPPNFRPQAVIPDLRAVLAAVQAGAGVSVLPTYLCTEELDRGEISIIHEPELPPINTLFLATRAGESETPAMRAACSELLRKAKSWY